ncbi:MAG: PEP/pyruvate-binding domain-containing protein [Polyangiales bacterium]
MNVVGLRSPEARSRTLCGGKGAELADLIGADLPVPNGIVVTTRAFSSFLDGLGVAAARAELASPGCQRTTELANHLRDEIARADVPRALADEITEKLADCEPGPHHTGLWAVRSSAIAEDTDTASFAGQYDTTLGVSAERVPEAIQRSWSSAFSERAIRYRRAHECTEDLMAVVVQRLLRADAAGVCFTVDPMTGDDDIVINANYGLGESVVGGLAAPDTYRVEPERYEVVSRLVGDKKVRVVAGASGVQTLEVSAEERAALCLTENQAADVARLAMAVEKQHGAPVDIEWAYEAGTLFLLQARSITSPRASLGPPPAGWTPANNTPIDPRYPLYSNGNISEVLPGCVTPLSWDHTGKLIEHAFRAQLEALGALSPADEGARVLGFFFHRPYVNVSLLVEASKRTPGMTPDTVLEEFVGRPDVSTPPLRAEDFMPHRLPALVRVARVVLMHLVSLNRQIDACRREADADAQRFTAAWLANAPDRVLLDHVRMTEDLARPSVVHVWASTLASVAFAQLRRLTDRWLGDEDGALASELVTGIERLPSAEPALELHTLSEKIACSDELARVFRSEADDASVLEALRTHPLHEELERFLHQYGHRGVAEAELSRLCWREDPAQVVALIRNNLRPGAVTPALVRERQRRAHQEAMKRLHSLSVWRRLWLRRLIRRARAGFVQRETMKDLVIRRLDRSRRIYQELNRRLVPRGLTASADDLFFLVWSEVNALLTGSLTPEDSAKIIERRSRDYRWSQQVEVPKIQRGAPRTLDPEELPHGLELRGLGVSPGMVTGLARVVTDPRRGSYIEPGEILVAPVTDVAWTPLFSQAAGLVVEVGGLLSHGSIVAREYGVPAVVGVSGATRTIQTGDRIRLDGARGHVFKLDAEGGA